MTLVTYRTKKETRTLAIDYDVGLWMVKYGLRENEQLVILNTVEVEDSDVVKQRINERDLNYIPLRTTGKDKRC